MNLRMQKALLAIGTLLLGGGLVWYFGFNGASTVDTNTSESENLGTYSYQCDGGAEFTMTLAAGMTSILISPIKGAVPQVVLMPKNDATSVYEGDGVTLTGAGEGISLAIGEAVLNCNPIPAGPDMAPFNWGD